MVITGSDPCASDFHPSQALASQEVLTQQKLSLPTTSGNSWNFGAIPQLGQEEGLGWWGGNDEVTGKSAWES